MITLMLKDGLGNQLFQYAAATALATKLGTNLKLDIRSYQTNRLRNYSLNHFHVHEDFVTGPECRRLRWTLFKKKTGLSTRMPKYTETGARFDPAFFDVPDNSWIEGYWQSEKYFLGIEPVIRQQFRVKELPGELNASLIQKMQQTNSVSVHVRRGDYVTNKKVNELHGVCSLDYYVEAIRLMTSRVNHPHFFVFSDDMAWTREHLQFGSHEVDHIDHNGDKDYEDLRLMYSCKSQITANSSFSWWGAWLNDRPGKLVICPDQWVKARYDNPDIFPPDWIRLER